MPHTIHNLITSAADITTSFHVRKKHFSPRKYGTQTTTKIMPAISFHIKYL